MLYIKNITYLCQREKKELLSQLSNFAQSIE